MLKRSVIFVACIVLIFATGALAQSDTVLAGQSGNRHGVSAVAGVASPGFGSGGNIPGAKDRPFSADIINETDQSLADGNHIHRDVHGKIFRDAEGRTRQEMELRADPDGSQQDVITILDPLAGIYVHLEPEKKSATLYAYGPLGIGTPVRAAPSAGKAGPQAMVAPSVTPRADTRRRSIPGVAAANFGVPTTEVEQLGTKVIEGFTVTGTRRTNITPAGAVGNDQPIVSSFETWFSNDLQIYLLTIMKNPQVGESTYKLVNIHAGNPDPQLFQVPADYAVKDNTKPQ
jgi:hypothetical protein